MTKDVRISLRGMQFGEDGAGDIETDVTGTYYEKNRSHYVLYEEVMEGFREPVRNRIKFGEHFLELTRSGPVNVRMIFEEKKKHMSNYHTPYGDILLGIDTKVVGIVKEPDLIRIDVGYALELNNEYLADCKILITIYNII